MFLLTLAIFDDVVAVVVIAMFYSDGVDWVALIVAAACVLTLLALPRLNIWRGPAYSLVGAGAVGGHGGIGAAPDRSPAWGWAS